VHGTLGRACKRVLTRVGLALVILHMDSYPRFAQDIEITKCYYDIDPVLVDGQFASMKVRPSQTEITRNHQLETHFAVFVAGGI